jgi:uncharacterized membrane protein
MKKTKFYLVFCLCIFLQSALVAQAESADFFRSMGKMYVVVAVLLIVLLGIVFFLIYLERRIKKLEQHKDEH